VLDAGQLDAYIGMVEDLAEMRDPVELAAAAFKLAALAREGAPARSGGGDGAVRRPARAAPSEAAPPEAEPAPPAARQEPVETSAEPAGRGRAPGAERPSRRGADDQREREGRSLEDGHAGRADMARLFLRVGRRDNVRPADIVGAVANEAGIPGDAVGDIDIYDTFSFVEVPDDMAERVLRALNRTTIRGRAARATLARPVEDGSRRDEDIRPRRSTLPLPPRRVPAPRRGAGRTGEGRKPTGKRAR
jgi:ATP-dependent RNA helicase DeaD